MRVAALLVTAIIAPVLWAAVPEQVVLHALFKDKAILLIDGARRVLVRGDASPEGIRLLTTDTKNEQAEIEINGRRETINLGVVHAAFKPSNSSEVMLWAESNGHFRADGMINGAPVRFLVDTGATTIAMSSAEAKRIGLDYKQRGRPGLAQTAAGVVRTYNLKLDSVQVGGIVLYGVEAGVIDGNHPPEVLLGMSFLSQLEIQHNGQQMHLALRF